MKNCDVLIVGAGPTGLVLALWLAKQGVALRIIDKTAEPGTTSRALAVQARTLELYAQLDLAEAVVEHGHKVAGVNLWVKGAPVARLPFDTIGSDLTPYSFLQIFPQDEHERLLIDRLKAFGIEVERRTELTGFVDDGAGVSARLKGPGGEETCEVRFLAGCDGARSVVRETLGMGFPGGTYRQIFYVADVAARGQALNGELHVDLDDADFLAVFPLAEAGHARLIGTVRDERADHAESLTFDDISRRAIENLKIEVDQVNWFSTYHVHHRVAEHFRRGRAFLLGDAAHIHSPAGGQGMNTGIGDAINLAWKLAAVLTDRAPDTLLDTYETERIAFARRLVATTDRAFTFTTADGPIADLVRTRIAPVVVPLVMKAEAVREFMFKTISQITLNYRGTPLSEGAAGHVHGGDRLPWFSIGDQDNFASLAAIAWQVHVYGVVAADVAAWCASHNVALHAFAWQPAYEAVGLIQDALYLIRPDTYIAMVREGCSSQELEHYFSDRGIRPGDRDLKEQR